MKGLGFIGLLCILASCTNEDVVKFRTKDPGVYAHYNITAEEGGEMTTCFAQFFTDKTMKRPLALSDPAKIELDGQAMPKDSTRFLGAYYELQKPVSEFEGQHTFTFTGSNHQQYKEELGFTALSLLTELKEPVSKANDLVLELKGVQPEDLFRVVLMDTAFNNDGVNQLFTAKEGKIVIDKNLLKKLNNGPVVMEISKESEQPLHSGMRGVLTTSYSLTRDLELTD